MKPTDNSLVESQRLKSINIIAIFRSYQYLLNLSVGENICLWWLLSVCTLFILLMDKEEWQNCSQLKQVFFLLFVDSRLLSLNQLRNEFLATRLSCWTRQPLGLVSLFCLLLLSHPLLFAWAVSCKRVCPALLSKSLSWGLSGDEFSYILIYYFWHRGIMKPVLQGKSPGKPQGQITETKFLL